MHFAKDASLGAGKDHIFSQSGNLRMKWNDFLVIFSVAYGFLCEHSIRMCVLCIFKHPTNVTLFKMHVLIAN